MPANDPILNDADEELFDLMAAVAALALAAMAACALLGLVALLGKQLLLPKPALLSIPYSHYVELARWALQARGLPFVEVRRVSRSRRAHQHHPVGRGGWGVSRSRRLGDEGGCSVPPRPHTDDDGQVKVPIGPHALVFGAYRLLHEGGLDSTSAYPGSTEAHHPW